MTVTLADLKERIMERVDPDTLVDLLNLSTEQLVSAFPDEVEEQYSKLVSELYEDSDDDHSGE